MMRKKPDALDRAIVKTLMPDLPKAAANLAEQLANAMPPEFAKNLKSEIDKDGAADGIAEQEPPRCRVAVNPESGVVEIDGEPYALVGTSLVRERVADFLAQLIAANGEFIARPANLKTEYIEQQRDAVRDLVDAQPGAGSRIPYEKLWRS